jgi:hypothetical protein
MMVKSALPDEEKGDEILRPVYKKAFSEILSGCFHF